VLPILHPSEQRVVTVSAMDASTDDDHDDDMQMVTQTIQVYTTSIPLSVLLVF